MDIRNLKWSVVFLACSAPAVAGELEVFTQMMGMENISSAPVDSDIDFFQNSVNIETSNESSVTSIKMSSSSSYLDSSTNSGTVNSWTIKFSSPIDKSSKQATPVTLDGLTNASRIGFSFNQSSLSGLVKPSLSEVIALCTKAGIDPYKENCDSTAIINKLGPNSGFNSLFFRPDNTRAYLWGISAEYGYDNFDYRSQENLKELEESEEPYSIGFHGGIHFRDSEFFSLLNGALLSAGFKYQKSFESGSTKTLCPTNSDSTDTYIECTTSIFDPPSMKIKRLYHLEIRNQFQKFAYSFKFTFDDSNKDKSIDFPFYLVRDSKKSLTGGVRLGWTHTEKSGSDYVFGIFIRSAFSFVDIG